MQLIQARFVTEDVAALAAYYAALLGTSGPLNGYYVELPAGPAAIGFSRCRFTEDRGPGSGCAGSSSVRGGEVIVDLAAEDVDAEYRRVDALGADWVFRPTTQPWGARSMMFRDPEGHLVNVVSHRGTTPKGSI